MEERFGIKLYNVKEVSKIIGVSEITVKTMLRDGRLAGRKIGKAWAISEDSIRTFLNPVGKALSSDSLQ